MILFGKEDIEGILEELEQTTGTNAKIALIAKHKENESLKAYFDVALNPYRIYHVKKLPTKPVSNRSINIATIEGVYSLGGLAKYLEKKKALKNDDRDLIYYYFEGLSSELKRKWAEKAILKKAIAGVSVKTVNKAYGKQVVPEYNLLLMSSWKEGYDKFKFPVYVQRKLDGYRCTYIPGIGLVGRSGKIVANLGLPTHLQMGKVVTIGRNPLNDMNSVFDGELYSHQRTFNEISSILSSENAPIPPDIQYHVFNVIPIEEWNAQKVSGTYTDQIQLLQFLLDSYSELKSILIPTYLCHNAEDLKALYDSFLAEGYEGAIVRDINFVYAWKKCTAKSRTITKLKPMDHLDAKIVSCFEWEGDYTQYFQKRIQSGELDPTNLPKMLGGFVTELDCDVVIESGSCKKLEGTVDVGSGFKEWQRIQYWNDREKLIGRWVRLQYSEITPDGSLRFPVFNNLRDDKE